LQELNKTILNERIDLLKHERQQVPVAEEGEAAVGLEG